MPALTCRPAAICVATLAGSIVLASAACSNPQGGTIVSAIVEVTPKSVQILTATAVRGVLPAFDSNRLRSAPAGSNYLLVEYLVSTGAAGTPPRYVGAFHVSLVPIVEDARRMPPGARPPAKPSRVLPIPMPDLPGSVVVSFSRLVPDKDKTVPPDKWQRVSLGSMPLPPISR